MNKLFPLLLAVIFNPLLTAENDPFEDINRVTMTVNKTLSLQAIVQILQKDGFDVEINNEQDITPTHLRHFTEIEKNCLSF